MCEVAPESAHHSVEGVRWLVESEILKTLAFSADSVILALLAEEVLELLDPPGFLPLALLALALALSCCMLAFLAKQLSSTWPGLSHHAQITAVVVLDMVVRLAAAVAATCPSIAFLLLSSVMKAVFNLDMSMESMRVMAETKEEESGGRDLIIAIQQRSS